MKKFFIIFFILCITGLVFYVIHFSIIDVREERIGLVEDLRSNKIIRSYYGKEKFIWQGLVPWWFSLYETPRVRSSNIDIIIPVPRLEELKTDIYSARLTVSVIYSINPDKFLNISKLKDNAKEIDESLKNDISKLISGEINSYFTPVYKADKINEERMKISESVFKNLNERVSLLGLEIVKLDISGAINYPDNQTYRNGLLYLDERRRISQQDEKKMQVIENRLKQEKAVNNLKYEKYKEMSKIIKDNPDMLKYIYIDKMGDKVKVIIPADKSGYPLNLDKDGQKSTTDEGKGDINNLK